MIPVPRQLPLQLAESPSLDTTKLVELIAKDIELIQTNLKALFVYLQRIQEEAQIPVQLTTAQRGALTPQAGWQIYNLSTNQMNYYNGTSWVAF